MRKARLLALVALSFCACQVTLNDPRGRACDTDHPCSEDRVCRAGLCVISAIVEPDGGRVPCDPSLVGASCSSGRGACAATGAYVCTRGFLACNAVEGAPSAELCDGVDNDCDGLKDNLPNAPTCQLDKGVCAHAAGFATCDPAGGFRDCDYGPAYEAGNETSCDGLDNDCDGIVDDVPGCLSTLAGRGPPAYAEGPPKDARFSYPMFLNTLASGELLVADRDNHVIRKVPLDGGSTSLLAGTPGRCGSADGPVATAQFCVPIEAVEVANGDIYVSDSWNNRIRLISGGQVTTVVGDGVAGMVNGPGLTARVDQPWGLGVTATGDLLFADFNNNRIRRYSPASGNVSTEAGSGNQGGVDGTRSGLSLDTPADVVEGPGNILYVTEKGGDRVRQIPPTGNSTTLGGSTNGTAGYAEGVGTASRWSDPLQIKYDGAASLLLIADRNNGRVRALPLDGGSSFPVAGASTYGFINGTGASALSMGLAGFVNVGTTFYVSDAVGVLRRIDASSGAFASSTIGDFYGLGLDQKDQDGPVDRAYTFRPAGADRHPDGTLYFTEPTSNAIRRVELDGTVSTVIGDLSTLAGGHVVGPAATARISDPYGLKIGPDGRVYFTEVAGNAVRVYDPVANTVQLYAGNGAGTNGYAGGALASALFNRPYGLSFGKDATNQDVLFVSDALNSVVRVIDWASPTPSVSLFAGTPQSSGTADGAVNTARFSRLRGMSFDAANKLLYVADNSQVRRVDASGTVSTPFAAVGFGVEDVAVLGTTLFVAGTDGFSGMAASINLGTGNITQLVNARPGWEPGLGLGAAGSYYFTAVHADATSLILVDRDGSRLRQYWR